MCYLSQLSVERARRLLDSFANYVHLSRVDQQLIHVLWLIDTEHYTEAMECLRDPIAGVPLLHTPWSSHVLQALVDAEKWREALTFLTLHNHMNTHPSSPHQHVPTRTLSYLDAVTHVRVLLHNRLFLSAFNVIVRFSSSSLSLPPLSSHLSQYLSTYDYVWCGAM